MAKKALGIEIKNFLKGGFPSEFVLSPCEGDYSESDLDSLEDNKFHNLLNGNFPLLLNKDSGDVKTFSQAFSYWKRKRNVSYLLVEVSKDKIDEAEVKITELGYKVRK